MWAGEAMNKPERGHGPLRRTDRRNEGEEAGERPGTSQGQSRREGGREGRRACYLPTWGWR